jgi:hypothetical protein
MINDSKLYTSFSDGKDEWETVILSPQLGKLTAFHYIREENLD